MSRYLQSPLRRRLPSLEHNAFSGGAVAAASTLELRSRGSRSAQREDPWSVRLPRAVDAIRDGIGEVTDAVCPVESFLNDVNHGAMRRLQKARPNCPESQIADPPQWQCRDSFKKLRFIDVRPASERFEIRVLKGVETIFYRL